MTLDEYVKSDCERLPLGYVTPITGNWCKHCESTNVYMEVRMEPVEPGGSLPGESPKITARRVHVLCCADCRRYSGDRRGT